MSVSTRISVRQRYPEHSKVLKLLKTYEKYAQFEAELADMARFGNNADTVLRRVDELLRESVKTLEALKGKQPVRIPEIKTADKAAVSAEKIFVDETRQKPLKKHEFKRPGHFIRYSPRPDPALDTRYNYEATQEDLLFLTELKGSPFTVLEFERLIDLFERENGDLENEVKPFHAFLGKLEEVIMKRNPEGVQKIYEYWKDLRTSRGGKGLLRKYWKPADPTNNDPRVTFRRCKDEKRNLRRNRKYDEDYLKKMESFKEYLLRAREIVKKCKEREELKRHMVALTQLDFTKQRNELLGLPTDHMEYKDTLTAVETLFLKKSKKAAGSFVSKSRELQKAKETVEIPYRQPIIPRTEEPQIAIEDGRIVCDFEFACFLSALAQRSAGNAVWANSNGGYMTRQSSMASMGMNGGMTLMDEKKLLATVVAEKKKEIKIEKRKRIDMYGEVIIDRRVQFDSLRYPFEPDWNLTAAPLQGPMKEGKLLSRSFSKSAEMAQELMLKPIQEQFYGNIYVFSDSEDNMDDLERRYKYLSIGFKNYAKQKKKLYSGKGSMGLIEA